MRLVIDTNVLVSALLSGPSLPARLIELWREGGFDLLTSAEQLDELMRVTRYPKIRARLPPALAGRLINDLRAAATVMTDHLPAVSVSADPDWRQARPTGAQALREDQDRHRPRLS